MNQDFKLFNKSLQDALISDLTKILSLIGNEEMYALALATDPFIDSLHLMLNSEESLRVQRQKKERYGIMTMQEYSELRWSPNEWFYNTSSIPHSKLIALNKNLCQKEVNDFAAFEVQFYESLLHALSLLKSHALFVNIAWEKVILFITVFDDQRAKTIENYSANNLNAPETLHSFLQRS